MNIGRRRMPMNFSASVRLQLKVSVPSATEPSSLTSLAWTFAVPSPMHLTVPFFETRITFILSEYHSIFSYAIPTGSVLKPISAVSKMPSSTSELKSETDLTVFFFSFEIASRIASVCASTISCSQEYLSLTSTSSAESRIKMFSVVFISNFHALYFLPYCEWDWHGQTEKVFEQGIL